MRDKREGVIVTWENGRDLLSNLPIRYHSVLQFEFQNSIVCWFWGSGSLSVFIPSKFPHSSLILRSISTQRTPMRDKREGVIVTWKNGKDLLSQDQNIYQGGIYSVLSIPIRYHSTLQFEFQHSFVCLIWGSGSLAFLRFYMEIWLVIPKCYPKIPKCDN